jgi:hypothetical protein
MPVSFYFGGSEHSLPPLTEWIIAELNLIVNTFAENSSINFRAWVTAVTHIHSAGDQPVSIIIASWKIKN